MEEKMEATTILCREYIGIVENGMETIGVTGFI